MKRAKILLAAALVVFAIPVSAAPIYIGSYNVVDGDNWTSNPDVYSALEAAELVFGAAAAGYEYAISVAGNNAAAITDTGWYSVIGIGYEIFADDFSADGGPTAGYNGSGWQARDDISAYVSDLNEGYQDAVNYVFAVAVPEPATLGLLGLGLVGLGFARRNKKA